MLQLVYKRSHAVFSVGSVPQSAQGTESHRVRSSASGFLHYLPRNIQCHYEYAHGCFTATENPEVFVLKKETEAGREYTVQVLSEKIELFQVFPRGNPHY